MAEEIDLEKCNFRKFRSSVTLILTLVRVVVILVRISGRGLPTHEIISKSEQKHFVDERTEGRTDRSSNLLDHRLKLKAPLLTVYLYFVFLLTACKRLNLPFVCPYNVRVDFIAFIFAYSHFLK